MQPTCHLQMVNSTWRFQIPSLNIWAQSLSNVQWHQRYAGSLNDIGFKHRIRAFP
ncbi:hypothetical protein ACPOL_0259 [Acidisarcina polymorpha]|uniref:Uncharacterized protein n=1 Tax=Acidisarcina polymorpha TaxID=2211140 RepID=A0A2Z5FT31_9BACT|nr:hypothetical protein ACPOL_0259 [Acidisarcina polymorpha]